MSQKSQSPARDGARQKSSDHVQGSANIAIPAPTQDIAGSNSLADLGARINEAHTRAMEHAGKAIQHGIACGEMLLEAKAKVPRGQWLPWLRNNITFGERSAQGYMRLAQNVPRLNVEDLSLRDALKRLATPRRYSIEQLLSECALWNAHSETLKAGRPKDVSDWSLQDAKNCADIIRGYDSIFHRHGICDPEDWGCLVCDAEHEANPQRVADLDEVTAEAADDLPAEAEAGRAAQ
jgi:hypothetical protein